MDTTPSPRGVVAQILVAVVGVAAWLTQTIYGNATNDLQRYALLIGGLVAILLGAFGTSLLVRNRLKRQLREESRQQSLHNDLLCSALSRTAVLIERAQRDDASPVAVVQAADDMLELVLSAAYSLTGECYSSVCFYELDDSAPDRVLVLKETFPRVQTPRPRPKHIKEGPVEYACLFNAIDRMSQLTINASSEGSAKMPLWSSSGVEYSKLIGAAVFAAGKRHGLLVACTDSKDCLGEAKHTTVMRILAMQLASCLSAAYLARPVPTGQQRMTEDHSVRC